MNSIRSLLASILMLAASLSPASALQIQPRIIGGVESEPSQWPYMTALMNKILGVTVAGQSFKATYLLGSPARLFSGKLVDCGLASEPCAGVKGNICLILRGNNTFADKVRNCAAGGGIGAIIYNNRPGSFLGTLQRAVTTIPAVALSQEDGLQLLASVGKFASFGYSKLIPTESFCGAAWIGGVWVVTAAHCVFDIEAEAIMVNVGGHDLRWNQDNVIGVAEVLVHNRYDPVTVNNDIALLQLERKPQGVKPVSVATPEQLDRAIAIHEEVYVLGRGQQEPVAPGDEAPPTPAVYELFETSLPLIDNATCAAAIDGVLASPGHITDAMVCAGRPEGNVGTCFGDSGGPMILFDGTTPYLGGITSWGIGCGYPGLYDVMTRVPHFRAEIEAVVSAKAKRGMDSGFGSEKVSDLDVETTTTERRDYFGGGALLAWLLAPLGLLAALRRGRARPAILITAVGLMLGGCQLAAATLPTGGEAVMKKLEALQDIAVEHDGVRVTVISTGCTTARDFLIELRDRADVTELAVYRIRPDLCRRAPMPVTLLLPWREPGDHPAGKLRIINPVASGESR